MTTTTYTLQSNGAAIVHDVHGALPPVDGRPPLLMVGHPMDASGFTTLIGHLPDRTAITYDPRGLGRSTRSDDRVDHDPEVEAADLHAVLDSLGLAGSGVDVLASSGGAITALALVCAHPDDVGQLVAHEPPLIPTLPDAEAAFRARANLRDIYQTRGWGAGMAAFIAMTSWEGEFTEDYFAQTAPDPAAFGLPTEDDGSRDDPLLSDRAWAISEYQPDFGALTSASTRITIALGEESAGLMTGRTAEATAARLGQQPAVFPSHHGGFAGPEFGYPGQPEAFARRLEELLG